MAPSHYENLQIASGVDRFRSIVSRTLKETRLFQTEAPILITRAPGRLDLMGGIADYSGSLVLQYPIREATFAAIQASSDRTIRIESITSGEPRRTFAFEISLEDLVPGGKLGSVADAKAFFSAHTSDRWAAYAVGAFVMLCEEKGFRFEQGVRILISSEVPQGKGVSSSAAIEVAVMKAVVELFGLDIKCRDLALLCQKVENGIVGAPCGVMDQMTSACGMEDRLIELLCQPAELIGTVELPDDIEIWGIDSGIRHSVAGADYGTVRTAAFMGYRMIAEMVGLSVQLVDTGRVRIEDPRWNGYLANVETSEFETHFAKQLPATILGSEFIAKYRGVSDPYSVIMPERDYPVHAATRHPIFENSRVRRIAGMLKQPVITDASLRAMGHLMYLSHDSYSACGLGSSGTNMIVDLVRQAGFEKGLCGAKITGGGSGGTVAILARRGSGKAVTTVVSNYEARTGRKVYVFHDSSPGACQFGSGRWIAE